MTRFLSRLMRTRSAPDSNSGEGAARVVNHADTSKSRQTAPTLKRNYFGAVSICLLSGFVAAMSWQAWRQQNIDTQAELATISEVGARALDSYLSQLEISMKTLAETLVANTEQYDVTHKDWREQAGRLVRQFSRLHIELTNVTIVHENGQVLLAANLPDSKLGSIAEEESFKKFPRVALYGVDVGQPMVDPATKRWIVPIRYRVNDRYENLLYFISADAPVEFFASFWKDAPIISRASIGVLRDDGYLLSRYPLSSGLSNDQVYGTPRTGALINFIQQEQFPASGNVRGYNSTEGSNNLNIFRRLRHYPITFFITVPMVEVWAEWWAKVRGSYVLSALMLLGGIAVYVITSRRQKRFESSLNSALLASEHASRELDIALDNMSHGICMFDASQKLVVHNQRYLEIYNLSPDVIKPGISLREFALHLSEANIVSYQDGKLKSVMATLANGKATQDVRELTDGRTIIVTNRPLPDGGWVATHEDITERRRAERKLEQTQVFLNTVIENMPAILSVKYVRTQTYALVNRAACILLGYPSDKMVDRTAEELFPKEQADQFLARDMEAIRMRGVPMAYESTVNSPGNGKRVLNTTKLTIADAGGEPEYLLTFSEDITERRKAETNIAHMAHHDALTGLANRVLLRERLETALLSVNRGGSLAVLYLDLDHFKSINDTLGHSIGDEFLKVIATRLSACVRGTDTVARLGGDEFVILLTGLQEPAEAETLATRVREAIAAPIELERSPDRGRRQHRNFDCAERCRDLRTIAH